ncbi:uncharacterized protein LOC143059771 [Mytilus galloprovincialis]|uniref:uncharacterized protein LOC143059771 n=1 Tax=Mytilus galloprovincialis TaxID=29158 RepID=UPI003F7BC0A5
MEITYLLLSAIFERNEFLNLSPNNIITALEIIWPDIHVPRVDSLKRHMLKVVSRCDKSSDLLNQKVSLLYTNCNVKFTVNGRMTNRDFLSMFTAMSKHHTIHEIYKHILPNFKLESPPSSVPALRQKYKKLTELRDKLQKNQKNYDLEHLLNSNFILPTNTSSTKQPNLNATKRKLDTFKKFQIELSKVGTEMQNMESELEISSEIAADFKLQYEMALDEIYELQTEIDVLVRECNNNDHTIHSLKSKLFRIESKYKTQSAKLEETNNRFNYHELRKFQKRESYHKKVICSQKNEIKKLKLDIDKSKTVEAEKRKTVKNLTYYKRQNNELKQNDSEQKQLISKLQKEVSERDRNIASLTEQVTVLLDDQISINTFSDGKYLPAVRQVVQDLHSFGVGVKHIGQTINSVLKHLLGVDELKLPSESSNRRMILESNLLAKMQIGEVLLRSQNSNTLHFDGTSDAQRHFLGFQITTPQANLSLAMNENVRGDTQTQVETIKENFLEIANLVSQSNEDINENYAKLMLSIKNMMSDQHIVNKNFYDEFVKMRSELLQKFESNWDTMSENEQEKAAEIHQWFCHLHLLANMGDSINKALKEYEKIITDGTGKLGRSQLPTFSSWSDKDSAAVRCIRTVCSALVSGGNASSGCPEDFKTYLFSKGKTCRLKRFEHTRFNIIFENAGAVIYHRNDIIDFFSKSSSSSLNMLQKSVLSDLQDKTIFQEILSVATIGQIITTPFLRLIDSKTVATHILDLNQHFLQLQINLKQWSKDPSDLISGETVLFPEVPPCKDDIFDAVFLNHVLPDTDVISESASLMSTHLYLTVSRLLKNQLPEGCHGTDNETIREESLTVPKHNRTSEKNFADFKQIRHFKPNASIEHIEATLMWVNNKTVEWLDLMDPEIKNAKITLAMKRAPEFISKWHERKIQLKQNRLEKLKEKETEKARKDAQSIKNKQTALDTLQMLNLQPCNTVQDVTEMLQKCKTENEKESALKAQITFYKFVIILPNVEHKLFFFSKDKKKFNSEQLMLNFVKILNKKTDLLLACNDDNELVSNERRKQLLKEKKDNLLSNQKKSVESVLEE